MSKDQETCEHRVLGPEITRMDQVDPEWVKGNTDEQIQAGLRGCCLDCGKAAY